MNTHWRQARGECSAAVECSKGSGANLNIELNTKQLHEEVEWIFKVLSRNFSTRLGFDAAVSRTAIDWRLCCLSEDGMLKGRFSVWADPSDSRHLTGLR